MQQCANATCDAVLCINNWYVWSLKWDEIEKDLKTGEFKMVLVL